MSQICTKQNFAFISYNHRDVKWAKWMRRKLEWYRLPSDIHNEFEESRYIRPVFRDRDELNSGVLSEELRQRLMNSKYLIVICSPNSAQSEWVSDEVKTFLEMGRKEYIIPFIVDGVPQYYANAKTCERPLLGECFPKALRVWNTAYPHESLLGIAIKDDGETNRQKAFIRVVSRMLGVAFDSLWQRHKREIRTIVTCISTLVAIVLILAYWFVTPVKLCITIKDDTSSLPEMEYGTLLIDGKEYSVFHPDTTIEVGHLPGYYRMQCIDVSFHADRYYEDENQNLKISFGLSQIETLYLHRDSTFATFAGYVSSLEKDGRITPISDAVVSIANISTLTDSQGYFSMTFPLSQQSTTKHISIHKEGYCKYEREDEVPSKELKFLLTKK